MLNNLLPCDGKQQRVLDRRLETTGPAEQTGQPLCTAFVVYSIRSRYSQNISERARECSLFFARRLLGKYCGSRRKYQIYIIIMHADRKENARQCNSANTQIARKFMLCNNNYTRIAKKIIGSNNIYSIRGSQRRFAGQCNSANTQIARKIYAGQCTRIAKKIIGNNNIIRGSQRKYGAMYIVQRIIL